MKKIILIITVMLALNCSVYANTSNKDIKVCSGFGKWTKDGEFKILRSKIR